MSGSNRGIYTAVGIGLLFALVIGFPLFREAGRLQAIYEQQASESAQYNRDSTRSRALERCSRVAAEQVTSCVYQEYDRAHQAEREAYDLQAQLVTSAWTRAMGIAAIVGMAVGIFGVGLIYKTFEETRRTADAAAAANVITEQAAMAPSQAYLSVSNERLWVVDLGAEGARFLLDGRFKNIGATPAFGTSVNIVASLYSEGEFVQRVKRRRARTSGGTDIANNGELGFKLEIKKFVIDERLFKSASARVLIAAQYRNAFGRRRVEKFRYDLRLQSDSHDKRPNLHGRFTRVT